MTEGYDLSNHLVTIALVVFYWQLLRLWSQPPPPPDRRGKQGGGKAAAPAASSFSGFAPGPELAPHSDDREAASPRHPVARGKAALAEIGSGGAAFDEAAFLAGAALAYERVVEAYAVEDLGSVESLLDTSVRSGFEEAIAARRRRGERREFTFVGLKGAVILDVATTAGMGEISVRFTGEASSATWSADGLLLCGEPGRIVETADVWTFSRRLSARDPNWTVIATDGE